MNKSNDTLADFEIQADKKYATGHKVTKNGTPIYYCDNKKTFSIPKPPKGFFNK